MYNRCSAVWCTPSKHIQLNSMYDPFICNVEIFCYVLSLFGFFACLPLLNRFDIRVQIVQKKHICGLTMYSVSFGVVCATYTSLSASVNIIIIASSNNRKHLLMTNSCL